MEIPYREFIDNLNKSCYSNNEKCNLDKCTYNPNSKENMTIKSIEDTTVSIKLKKCKYSLDLQLFNKFKNIISEEILKINYKRLQILEGTFKLNNELNTYQLIDELQDKITEIITKASNKYININYYNELFIQKKNDIEILNSISNNVNSNNNTNNKQFINSNNNIIINNRPVSNNNTLVQKPKGSPINLNAPKIKICKDNQTEEICLKQEGCKWKKSGRSTKKTCSKKPGPASKKQKINFLVQKPNKIEYSNWIQKLFKDNDYNIIETKTQGDCFFDSIYKALPQNLQDNYSIQNIRKLLHRYITKDLMNSYNQNYTDLKKEILELELEFSSNSNSNLSVNEFKDMTNNEQNKIKKYKLYNISKKMELQLDEDLLARVKQYKFMDNYNTIEKYKQFVLTPEYWADQWSIPIIEKEMNIKLIILDENKPTLNMVIQCGDFIVSDPNFINEPSCEICNIKLSDKHYIETNKTIKSVEILENVIRRHNIKLPEYNSNNNNNNIKEKYDILLKIYKEIEHQFKDANNNIDEYIPTAYIIVTYSGNHYRLVSYKNKTFIELQNLPKKLLTNIKNKCKKVGLFKYIKGIGIN